MTGAVVGHIDVAQITLYAFWFFFAGLIFYLRREDRREGYPLENDTRAGMPINQGILWIPEPKTFLLPHGGSVQKPDYQSDTRPIAAEQPLGTPGSPLIPTGNPMLDGVGPASYAQRSDTVDLTYEGKPKIVPLRVADDFYLDENDPDPRGMKVLGADRRAAGVVKDIWVDRSEHMIRYLEVELTGSKRNVLVPMNCTDIIGWLRQIVVEAILASQFAGVPKTKASERVTLLEEDKIQAYFAGGLLYAEPLRQEPLL